MVMSVQKVMKVKAGHPGRKTGKGWYEYNEDGTIKNVTL
jgi:3-hydroxyacyl-CoA dehydrogenase